MSRFCNATLVILLVDGGLDNADLEQGEMIFYPGSFLIGEVTNYDFTPYNATVRVENGRLIEMIRSDTP